MKKLQLLICWTTIFLGIGLLQSGCEKRVLEVINVLQVIEDLSIPTEAAIMRFNHFNDGSIVAVDSTGNVWKKSVNQIWQKSGELPDGILVDVNFGDSDHGICRFSGPSYYHTSDGGKSWVRIWDYYTFYSDDNRLITVEHSNWDGTLTVYASEDFGATRDSLGTIRFEGDVLKGRISQGKLMFITGNSAYEGFINGLDLTTGEEVRLGFDNGFTHGENPEDIYFDDPHWIIVGPSGVILEGSESFGSDRRYYGSRYHFYSVDGFKEKRIAVGERSIITYEKVEAGDPWMNVYDKDGNGHSKNFYHIRFNSDGTFYISGSQGTLLHAKI